MMKSTALLLLALVMATGKDVYLGGINSKIVYFVMRDKTEYVDVFIASTFKTRYG